MTDFTPEEEALLKRSEPNTAKLSRGQLEGYEEAYRPGGNLYGRTRQDDLSYEAIRREIAKRKERTDQAVALLLRHVHGAPNVHFGDPRERHASIGRSVHRLTDDELNRRFKIYQILCQTDELDRLGRKTKTDIYDVGHELRAEIEYRRKSTT